MMNYGYGGGMMGYGFGGIFMWIIFIVIVVLVIYFIVSSTKGKNEGSSSKESALDILKKRYAKGEISKEEFERIKKDLESK